MRRGRWTTCLCVLLVLAVAGWARAQSNDDCLMCHEDPDLSQERDGRVISLYLDQNKFARSVHGQMEMECIDCHADLAGSDFPHAEKTDLVDCAMCHDDVAEIYQGSLHGQAVAAGERFAPHCWDCHGAHDILKATDPASNVTKYNIPFMCGRCHKEGTEVNRLYDIPQDSILTHYSQGIHGEGLYKQGLTVSAVCIDCHTAHNVLPHTDPRSSIFHDNVPKTCQKCHGLIEQVHRKVIRGELWEKEPNKVPVCIDCHQPHRARKIFYDEGMSNQDCLRCHSRPDLFTIRRGDTISLYVDAMEIHDSTHRNIACAQCHTGATPSRERACATISTRVDCSICHAEVVAAHERGIHGQLVARGDPQAPTCQDCHGVHGIREHVDPSSPTYATKIPDLCGECHRHGHKAALRREDIDSDIVGNYVMSIHGKGLLESGLVITATCTDCHTSHQQLPKEDPASSVSHDNIAATCGHCHAGIYEKFQTSVCMLGRKGEHKATAVCNNCHTSHTIRRTDEEGFKLEITETCGHCHEKEAESYFQTYHGKVSKLGYAETAKCYDCHGAHSIKPIYDPDSPLSRRNIVATCGKCHPGSHRRFAGYLTHATHHDRDKYPFLYYSFVFMTALLVGTFLFFGIHALLWLPRSFQSMKHARKLREASQGKLEFRRFDATARRLHLMVIISFLSLAVTGMILKFSYFGWAQFLARLLGGFQAAGLIHRAGALLTFTYFGIHLFTLVRTKRRTGVPWREFLVGPRSMMFNRQDARQFTGTIKWFIGLGPRPSYGRWTYWEKFDYFAVFWGVTIIGLTGLMLWFPELFTRVLPGWMINVATIVHSDEALLAAGFIFTIHFFNTHFRPDKFPMDTVIFTGRVPLEEFKEDRPREYEELVQAGELEQHLVEPLPSYVIKGFRIFGWTALSIGLLLIIFIIWTEVFGYR
jgi:cytochrome b subunit of formate dehydrogenase